jgi:hypothetical protein
VLAARFRSKQDVERPGRSATANSSSINCLFMYTGSAKDSGGWIVLAADGPFAPPKGDTTQWRWAMARAACARWRPPGPPRATGPSPPPAFPAAPSARAISARCCAPTTAPSSHVHGRLQRRHASEGLKDYRPDRATFRKVPVYISAGKKDVVATVAAANKVRVSLEATGFREVRLDTYDGAHEPDSAQITEALNWFKELHAPSAAPAANAARRAPGVAPAAARPARTVTHGR